MAVEADCLYAADWRLLRVVLQDFDSRHLVSLLVERTGGDSMRLRSPPEVWFVCVRSRYAGLFQACPARSTQ